MLGKIHHYVIYVRDQEKAVDFYCNTLGFEKRTDNVFGGGMRWIEVGLPGDDMVLTLLLPYFPDRPMGIDTEIGFTCADAEATYNEFKAKGVEMAQELAPADFGTYFQFKDPDGNQFLVLQPPPSMA